MYGNQNCLERDFWLTFTFNIDKKTQHKNEGEFYDPVEVEDEYATFFGVNLRDLEYYLYKQLGKNRRSKKLHSSQIKKQKNTTRKVWFI